MKAITTKYHGPTNRGITMRVHFVLNHDGSPESKLADVEIHFEEGPLSGLKLVGCSIWRSRKGEEPTILVPSRSVGGGIRYYELLRNITPDNKTAIKDFKTYIREEYMKIAEGRR